MTFLVAIVARAAITSQTEFANLLAESRDDSRTQAARLGFSGVRGVAKNIADFFLHTPSIARSASTESGFHWFFEVADYELSHLLASVES